MAVASVWGFAVVGIDAVPVRVEAHARSGLPVSPLWACREPPSEKLGNGCARVAASSGLALPSRRITINLSPGDVPKVGPGFDLPVALATLAACGHMPVECVRDVELLAKSR
jgi:magnesium chelatase family protein